jgi:hypothetical protein
MQVTRICYETSCRLTDGTAHATSWPGSWCHPKKHPVPPDRLNKPGQDIFPKIKGNDGWQKCDGKRKCAAIDWRAAVLKSDYLC